MMVAQEQGDYAVGEAEINHTNPCVYGVSESDGDEGAPNWSLGIGNFWSHP